MTIRAVKELAAAAEALRHDDGADQLREQLAQSRQVRVVRVRSPAALRSCSGAHSICVLVPRRRRRNS